MLAAQPPVRERRTMFQQFFTSLRQAHVPVTLREYLTLMEALDADLAEHNVENFYYLARAAQVKDERNLDKFDRVFGETFKRLEKQKIRHQGGSKWIGTGGTSPFGAYGSNPAGIRIGQDGNRNFRAVKVWDRREFKDLDGNVELGVRNIKVALRRLRKFARTGAAEELDLVTTIKQSANRGYLDVLLRPERHNAIKVLIFFDIGGSMDAYIEQAEELFSAARTEFKHLEFFYFHNCLYVKLWKDNRRRHVDTFSTAQLMHTYPPDYKVIFVGDASMSPY